MDQTEVGLPGPGMRPWAARVHRLDLGPGSLLRCGAQTWFVPVEVMLAYEQAGGPSGPLGLPTSGPVLEDAAGVAGGPAAYTVRFEHGAILVTDGTDPVTTLDALPAA